MIRAGIASAAHTADPVPIDAPRRAFAGVPMRARQIAVVGNYPPSQCGLATFTQDMIAALLGAAPSTRVDVYATVAGPRHEPGDDRIKIHQVNGRAAYRAAGEAIAASSAELVWVQHEFGIFGGDAGAWLLELLRPVAVPVVVTLHTISEDPAPAQRAVMEALIDRASRIVVMSRHGGDVLTRQYGVPRDRVVVIPHGAPDRPFGRSDAMKRHFGIAAQNVLMTFGLLSPNKGLENAIRALPAVIARHPDTVYCIVGATHSNLIAQEGEAYRERLQSMARELGVAEHIRWFNAYLDVEELLDLIEACDIYVTPYRDARQSTSGTLTYAVTLGKAVLSTPYCHARELVSPDIGILVPFDDPQALAAAACDLLADRDRLGEMQRAAYRAGRAVIWPRFGQRTIALIDSLHVAQNACYQTFAVPPTGLLRLCDDTGIIQHSVLSVPDRSHGYCIDDNARALMLAATSYSQIAARAAVFAAFVQHGWNAEGGGFRNFMGYDRRWCEDQGSQDSNGRALWALGVVAACGHDVRLREWAAHLWAAAAPIAAAFTSPRAVAFAMLGADALLDVAADDAPALAIIARGTRLLDAARQNHADPSWPWFEASLSYDNARLPQALLAGAIRLDDGAARARALESLAWLCERQTAPQGYFRPVGTLAFGTAETSPFDQQAVDAWASVDAMLAANAAAPAPHWIGHAQAAFAWFFGANDRGLSLIDRVTGSCADGITPHGLNHNCGAESVLALHLAQQSMAMLSDSTGPAALPHRQSASFAARRAAP